MKCAWYEAQLANESAELWRNGRPSPAFLEHSRQCAACDRTIERELNLKLLFTELAEQSRRLEPSTAVHQNLQAQLAALRPQKTSGFGWIPRLALAAAALACIVLVLLFAHRSSLRDTRENVAKSPVQQPAQAETPTVQQPAPAVQLAAKTTPKSVKHAARTSDPAPAEAANSDFYPMVMCDSITCAGPAVTVRVELPASQFSTRRNSGHKVMADLLVGDDGLVRGVRLLQ